MFSVKPWAALPYGTLQWAMGSQRNDLPYQCVMESSICRDPAIFLRHGLDCVLGSLSVYSQRPVLPSHLSLSPSRGLESDREAVVGHSTAWRWGWLGVCVWGAGKWERRDEENDQSFSFFWKVVRRYNSSSFFSFASCSLLCPWQFLVLSFLHLLKKISSSESCMTSVSHFTSLVFLCREKKLN